MSCSGAAGWTSRRTATSACLRCLQRMARRFACCTRLRRLVWRWRGRMSLILIRIELCRLTQTSKSPGDSPGSCFGGSTSVGTLGLVSVVGLAIQHDQFRLLFSIISLGLVVHRLHHKRCILAGNLRCYAEGDKEGSDAEGRTIEKALL